MNQTTFIGAVKNISRTAGIEVKTRQLIVTGQTNEIDKIEELVDNSTLVAERVSDRKLMVAYFSKN